MSDLVVRNISKKFDKLEVLSDLCYTFERGNIYCIKGQNGSGKTTLFKIILGLLKSDSGEVLTSLKVNGLIEEACGYKGLSANDMLLYLLDGKNLELIQKYANLFGIVEHLNESFDKLSLGMKQKILLIYMFSIDSDIIILDEPTNSLDKASCEILTKILKEKKKENKCIIISSHDSYFFDGLSDIIRLRLNQGKLFEIEKTEMIEIIVCCNQIESFELFLSNEQIEYNRNNSSFHILCEKTFVNYLINIREDYEISNISF